MSGGNASDTQAADLVQLAEHRALAELEEAWLALAEQVTEAPLEPFIRAAEIVASQQEQPLAATLLLLLAPGLRQAGRWAELLRVLRLAAGWGARGEEVRAELVGCLRRLHAGRPGLEAYLERSGLTGTRPLLEALAELERFLGFPVGQHVFHAAGWGVGRVVEVVPHTGELVVDFEERRGHRIPIEGAVQFLERLPADDIRALCFSEPERLRRLAAEEPAELIRLCVRSRGGSAPLAQVKNELLGRVVAPGEWSRFWARARRVLIHDPHVHLGTGSRPTITLRESALSFAEQIVEELAALREPGQAVPVVRRFLRELDSGSAAIAPAAIGQVAEAARACLAAATRRPLRGERAGAAWELGELLRELQARAAAGEAGSRPAASGGVPPAVAARGGSPGELVGMLLGVRDARARERLARETAARDPEGWQEAFVAALAEAPREAFGPLAALLAERAPEALGAALMRLVTAADPHPEAFLALARAILQEGTLAELPGAPSRALVLERLLALVDKLERRRAGGGGVPNLRPQVRALLEPEQYAVVRRYFEEASPQAAQHLYARIMASHALDDEVREAARAVVARRFPDLLRSGGEWFWEDGRVYATRAGIARQQQALHVLKSERMSEVARAIGQAAAFGDLSENAEFTAALEERDRLVARIERMHKELEQAVPLEEVEVPVEYVAPGTEVTVRDEAGAVQRLRILGPWDVDESAGIISYTAPLAAGLLGRRPGELAEIRLPDGAVRRLRIERIERAV
ncbi:MAG: hypothetical protein KatS3mg102_0083 [Planctomycetota bacterium]|nr:MAG: hypothetical protein KatS3mg102_0083 [Planctomycetota bacterium]